MTLRDVLEFFGFKKRPVRRLVALPIADGDDESDEALVLYGGGLDVRYEHASEEYLTREEALEDVEYENKIARIQLETLKHAADARSAAANIRLQAAKTMTEVTEQQNKREQAVAAGALEKELRPVRNDTAKVLADTENARARKARAEAEADAAETVTESEIRKNAAKKKYVESLGPSEDELEKLRSREEQQKFLEEWAYPIALDVARWTGTLRFEPPITEDDGYYAYAGVHYYGAMIRGQSDAEALKAAVDAMIYRREKRGALSEQEAKDTAKKCRSVYSAWKQKQHDDEVARREAQAAGIAVEVSRNEVEAANARREAAEKLDNIIQGKRGDDEHFDSKA